MIKGMAMKQYRQPDYEIEQLFLDRWSPRAFTKEPISDGELMTLLEAARWAPSSYNEQPWRFIYAKREGPHWDKFVSFMGEFNQSWACNASVLFVVASRTTFERNDKPNACHAFDSGAAWQNLALQASLMGLAAHGMAGIDYEKAARGVGLPDNYEVRCMVAVGKPGDKESLPEKLREREQPSGRKPIGEWASEGEFQG